MKLLSQDTVWAKLHNLGINPFPSAILHTNFRSSQRRSNVTSFKSMQVCFLISLHSSGAEKFFKELVSQYSQRSSWIGELVGGGWKSTNIVIFGSKDKLNICKEACSFAKGVELCCTSDGYVNKYDIAGKIKNYIEFQRLADQHVIYIVNDITEEDYWCTLESSNYTKSSLSLSKLQFLDGNVLNMHEKFGCGLGCTVDCAHCRSKYKKCDVEASKKHARMQSGMCLNNGCSHKIYLCDQSSLKVHLKTHLPPCKTCDTLRGECQVYCYCGKLHCFRAGCECIHTVQLAKRGEYISRNACPICAKAMTSRQGLEAHFKHCFSNGLMISRSLWNKCQCGFVFMDEDHKTKHTTGKKKCKEFAAPQAPAPAPKMKYDETRLYYVQTPAPPTLTTARISNVFARDLVRQICSALGTENSPLYTLSKEEMSKFSSSSEKIDKVIRSSGIVAETTGFGSTDKGTGVPGFVDIDMLVSINNFAPTEREIYKETFSRLLKEAGANIMDSAPDILQIEYDGLEFDLVLVGINKADNDKRASDFAEARRNVGDLRAVVGTDNYVKEVIRAAKYWSKRTFSKDGIKSCLVEAVVLDLYTKSKAELAALPTQCRRRIKLFSLFIAFVAGTPPSSNAQGKPSASTATVDILLRATPFTENQHVAARLVRELLPLHD